jgi:hypothetical protein
MDRFLSPSICGIQAGQRCERIENFSIRPWIRSVGEACVGPETVMWNHSALGASTLLLVALGGCSTEQRELSRKLSPDQKLVAVLMESLSESAAGSLHQDIHLNDQGAPLNLDKPVFSAVGCDHVSFNWVNDYTLEIHYETTCAIAHFTNRWDRTSNIAAGRPNPVEIILMRN